MDLKDHGQLPKNKKLILYCDCAQVGRGNRVNGLISMNRPMGTEAAAGKNPVSQRFLKSYFKNLPASMMLLRCSWT